MIQALLAGNNELNLFLKTNHNKGIKIEICGIEIFLRFWKPPKWTSNISGDEQHIYYVTCIT